jgi:hypothetical protein
MWSVRRVVNFAPHERFTGCRTDDGLTLLGLHSSEGGRFLLGPKKNWIGYCRPGEAAPSWMVGPKTKRRVEGRIAADLNGPSWVTDCRDGTYLVSDAGHDRICLLDPARGTLAAHIDLRTHGVQCPANCILDHRGNIWVNDPSLPMLWVFTHSGELLRAIGDTAPPEEAGREGDPTDGRPVRVAREMSLDDMNLAPVYDIACGKDGLVYILEGPGFRLRAIDFQRNLVLHVAGCGAKGYFGDGGDPRAAAFGSSPRQEFDGPWAFCLDEKDGLYIADTHNGVIRMIDPERRGIATIAGGRMPAAGTRNHPGETDPLKLSLPSVFWMDWGEGMLYVSDRNGDLIVLSPDG